MEQYSQYIFIIAIVAVFYFLIIRPQKKRQQQQAELMSSLKPGAEIMTIGGMYGTIVSIDGDRVRIAAADGTEMVFSKSAIARTVASAIDGADEPDEADTESTDESDADATDTVGTDVTPADESESSDV